MASTVLVFLSLSEVRAQSADPFSPWAQCEVDELAQEIVPIGTNTPPTDTAPLQAEAGQVESSPTQSVLEGDVKLSRGNQRLRAERVTLDRSTNRARSEGPFVYGDPQQALRGKQAEVDLNTETGRFKEVDYYLPARNAQGSAEKIQVERSKGRSLLEGATFSTCTRGHEVWELRAEKLWLKQTTGRGEARDIVLALGNVPIFYLPYLSFPISNERQSGLLFPRWGYTSSTGMDLTLPYYWNIAPNRDMTITPRWMAARGFLLGGEYRFLYPKHSGQINFEYIPQDKKYGGERGSFNISHRATPFPDFYTDLHYEYVSDDYFISDLNNNLAFLSSSYLERHLDARYYGDNWRALARIQSYDILNPGLFSLSGKPYERLPQLLFEGAWPGAGGFSYGLRSELVNFQQTNAITGTRLDIWPTVTWSLERPWGYLKPEASVRHTQYQLNSTPAGADSSPSRTAVITSLDTGLIFERALKANWLGIQSGTQTLEPRLFYLYVPYSNQKDIPVFDSALLDQDHDWLFHKNRFTGGDRVGDANQLTAALTTRVLDGASGRERLRASIGQIQYFTDRKVTLEPNGLPDTSASSGLIAQGQLNLAPRWSLQGSAQMEPNNKDLLRSALDLRYYASPRQLVNISYLMDRDQPSFLLKDQIESLDVSLVWPLSTRWRVMGRWNQALNVQRNLETLAGLEYEDCCWAVRAAARRYRNSPSEVEPQTAFYLELELKGLSRLDQGLETLLQGSIQGYQSLTRY